MIYIFFSYIFEFLIYLKIFISNYLSKKAYKFDKFEAPSIIFNKYIHFQYLSGENFTVEKNINNSIYLNYEK